MGFGEDEELVVGLPNKSIFRYNSPLVQVCLIGLVCLCCLGMFNTLFGMGEGGQVDVTTANNANTALYTTFAIFGVLGKAGAIITSYPLGGRVYTYRCFGASSIWGASLVGSSPSFELQSSDVALVNNDTYIGFMCFMSSDTVLTLAILHPSCVVWDDDNHCTNIKYSDVLTEAVEILKLFRNWKMLLMVPAAWAGTRPRPAPKTHLVWGWDPINPPRLGYGMGMRKRFI
ncbi:hypothetical protein AAG906_017568 [Vitis piasezkii]